MATKRKQGRTFADVQREGILNSGSGCCKTTRTETCTDTGHKQQCMRWHIMLQYRAAVDRLSSMNSSVGDAGDVEFDVHMDGKPMELL